MRQIIALLAGIEGKLQHLHARIAGLLDQPDHRRRHIPEILGDDRTVSQRFFQRVEKRIPGPGHPFSIDRGLLSVRNFEILVKAAEVIDPHDIIAPEAVGKPFHPPGKIRAPVILPIVNRISPQLSCRGEPIRRAPGHHRRISLVIQLEQLRMAPCVRAVKGHINRNIPDDLHAVLVCIRLERFPLPAEIVLLEPAELNLVRELLPASLQCFRFSQADIVVPLNEAFSALFRLHGAVQRVILQPGRLPLTKCVKILSGRIIRRTGEGALRLLRVGTVLIRLFQQSKPHRIDLPIIDVLWIAAKIHSVQFLLREKALLHKGVQINKIGISRIGRKRLIRRIAVPGRSQWQDLPIGLPCLFQKINKLISFL